MSNLTKWYATLTPEQREEHKAKMAEGRRKYQELKKAQALPEAPLIVEAPVGHTYFATPLVREQAVAPEYAPLFRKLLGEYLDILACMTGGGTYSTDYCKLCVQTGIHGGTSAPCGCPCHRGRAALACFDES